MKHIKIRHTVDTVITYIIILAISLVFLFPILWLLLAVYFCFMRYGLGKKPAGVLQIGGCLAALMAVVYLIRMYREFPGDVPLCYTPGNLLERLWPGYGSWVTEKIGGLQKAAELWLMGR